VATIAEPEDRLAILIDADNTPYDAIQVILDRSHKYGRAIIKRAYGDWSRTQLQPWGAVFKEFAIKAIHQPQFTSGKNSTDSAMLIDAMDILNGNRADIFMLVSSDSDFTGLAMRIREQGLRVIGVGREITPTSFIKGCDDFILIENLMRESRIVARETTQVERKETGTPEGPQASEGAALLTKAVLNVMNDDGEVLGTELAVMMRKLDPTFSPQNYGVLKLSEFVAKYPDILKKTAKRSGMDVVYQSQIAGGVQ